MDQTLLFVLTFSVSLLLILMSIFFIFMIIVMVLMKRSLAKLDKAIDTVEDRALETLEPLRNVKTIFSDMGGFLSAGKAMMALFSKTKKRKS